MPALRLANTLDEFAYLRRTQGDSKDAEIIFREALTLGPELPPDAQHVVAINRSTLASTLADEGQFEQALQTARETVEEQRRQHLTTRPPFGFSLTILGGFLADAGRFDEAIAALQEGEATLRRTLQPSHLWLGDNLRNQAIAYYRRGEFEVALAKAEECVRIYLAEFGTHYDQYPTALSTRGLILSKLGKLAQGEADAREALRIRKQMLPPQHFWVGEAEGALGECLVDQHRFEEARPLLSDCYNILKRQFGPDDPRTLAAAPNK